MRESVRQAKIRQALMLTGKVCVNRNSVGFDHEKKIHYGFGVGSPDLMGWIIGSCRGVAWEIKTPTGRLSDEQKAYHKWFRGIGGFVMVARDEIEALAGLGRAIRGEFE